jgi:hypothetical protein
MLSVEPMRSMAQLGALAGTLACAAWSVLPASRAHACSGWLCSPSLYFPAEGTVPVNLPGFYWWPAKRQSHWEDAGTWDDASDLPALLRLARIDGASPEWLEVELHEPEQPDGPYLVVPDEPLVAGAEYVLWDATECSAQPYALDTPPSEDQWLDRAPSSGWPGGIAHVRVADAAPLPDELGALNAAEPTVGAVPVEDGAGCSGGLDAPYVELTITHDAAARPWRDALFYATSVDDEPYAPYGEYNQLFYGFDFHPGTSFVGRARDRVYTSCQSYRFEGVDPGAHRARIHATIPGTDLKLETHEVSFTLTCPERLDGGTDAGSDAGSDAASDAGSNAGRGGAIDDMDAAVDAGTRQRRDAEPVRRHDEGCAVATDARGHAPWTILLALGWLARRRARGA